MNYKLSREIANLLEERFGREVGEDVVDSHIQAARPVLDALARLLTKERNEMLFTIVKDDGILMEKGERAVFSLRGEAKAYHNAINLINLGETDD